MVEFEYEELVKATENFSASRIIGKGSHGWVFKGKLKNGELIAVKKPLDNDCQHEVEVEDRYSKLENEIRILSLITHEEKNHPYIIRFLGSSRDTNNKKVLVEEFMPNGSLHDLLYTSERNHDHDPQMILPSWPKRVEMAFQIARAVQWLHERRPHWVIHRDIKSANILLDSNWDAKLADFGLALQMGTETESGDCETEVQPAGTIGYMDPGYTSPSKASPQNDVYSIGVVVLEIISGRRGMDVGRPQTWIWEWAGELMKQGRSDDIWDPRISMPPHMESTVNRLLMVAASCVSMDKGRRPSIGQVVLGIQNCLLPPPQPQLGFRFPVCSWISVLRIIRRRRKFSKPICNIGNLLANQPIL